MNKMLKYTWGCLLGLWLIPASLYGEETPDSLQVKSEEKTASQSSRFGLAEYRGKSDRTVLYYPVSLVGISRKAETSGGPKKNWFRAMRYSGYSRFFVYYRNLKEKYDFTSDWLSVPVNLTVADGYQNPLLLFSLQGNPTPKSWFQTELQFDHLFLRTSTRTNADGRYANLFVLFQLQGGIETQIGKIRMIAGGGANWYRLSPSTLWGYQYRDDFFERYPWEPEGHDFGRYNSFYFSGDIPRDQRFGMQATQGFILEGTNMPAGFDAAILYGKTSSSAGFQSYLTSDPINMLASRVGKKVGDHKVGVNYFSQYGYNGNQVQYKKIAQGTDTVYVEDNYVSTVMTTADARLEFKNVSFYTEFGVGSYMSNLYNVGLKDGVKAGVANVSRYQRDWDETFFLEITTKKRITYVPMKFGLYRIGALVVNNNSNVSNTSVEQAKATTTTPDEYYTSYYDGMVTEAGQLANNRQGFSWFVNKDFYYNKVKTKLAIAAAQEIENLAGDMRNGARSTWVAGAGADSVTRVPFTNSITFEHKLNGITRSRFGMFKRLTGPYARYHSIYRRAFENIAITDSVIDYKKSFSNLEFETKYKFTLFKKEIIAMNFICFNSVQDRFLPIPVFTDKAFLRYFYEELMLFYNIHPKFTLVGFYGYEKVLGNNRVEMADENGNIITNAKGRPVGDPSGKTINQTGNGFGLGVDYNFHSRASLHFRNRIFDSRDKNFTQETFRGYESSVEFKVFF